MPNKKMLNKDVFRAINFVQKQIVIVELFQA